MPRKLFAALSLSHILFIISSLVPFLVRLVVPRSISGGPEFLDLMALLVLMATSTNLAIGTAERRRNGKGFLYPVLGIAAVAGYLYSENALRQAGDYLGFALRKPSLEAHMARVAQRPLTTDSLAISRSQRIEVVDDWGDEPPPGITYYTLDGQASICFWGYAYSPEDRKPASSDFTYWHQLDGHWYMWFRRDIRYYLPSSSPLQKRTVSWRAEKLLDGVVYSCLYTERPAE